MPARAVVKKSSTRGLLLAGAVAAMQLAVSAAPAQGPVAGGTALTWRVNLVPQAARPGDEAVLVFSAEIAHGWILYSCDFSADIGPRPARFNFEANDAIAFLGPVRAVNALQRKDKTWGAQYRYFEKQAEFRQKVRIVTRPLSINGHIDGQTCHEEDGVCALFHKQFSVSLD
jgi:thiol:disulfide interchange protein DsbD